MGIMLGNLTIEEFGKRSGVVFSEEDKKFLGEHRVNHATAIPKDGFHIFDIPYSVMCGSGEFARELYGVLSKYDFSHSPKLSINRAEPEGGK
jgi:hypothetical protein